MKNLPRTRPFPLCARRSQAPTTSFADAKKVVRNARAGPARLGSIA